MIILHIGSIFSKSCYLVIKTQRQRCMSIFLILFYCSIFIGVKNCQPQVNRSMYLGFLESSTSFVFFLFFYSSNPPFKSLPRNLFSVQQTINFERTLVDNILSRPIYLIIECQVGIMADDIGSVFRLRDVITQTKQ